MSSKLYYPKRKMDGAEGQAVLEPWECTDQGVKYEGKKNTLKRKLPLKWG